MRISAHNSLTTALLFVLYFVKQLRPQLDAYPLALYLDYARLESRLRHVPGSDAMQFLDASRGSPLQLRFKDRYLRRAGRDRRWKDFLKVAQQAPRDIELQCYYYRAQRTVGDEGVAWDGARRLWLYGKSPQGLRYIVREMA
jgi:soluble lytic murein transglycosylase